MTYKLTAGWPRNVETGEFVNPETNPDYLAWLEAGNTPAPVDPQVAQVPVSVTRFQGRAALWLAGHFHDVEAYMDRADTPMLHKLAWQDAQDFERNSLTIAAIAQVLPLSEAQLDALFVAAAAIKA